MSTDWKKPQVDTKDTRNLLLLIICIAMLAVVFIPWFCIGAKVDIMDMSGSVKLRAFGFTTLYGFFGIIAALTAITGVVYKHLSLTFWSSLIAVCLGIVALNSYPESKLVVKVNDELKKELNAEWKECYEGKIDYEDPECIATAYVLGKLPKFKVPGVLVEVVDAADQRLVRKIMKHADLQGYEDHITPVKHRLGALLFLFLGIGATALSYFQLGGRCKCGCKKNIEEATTVE